MKKSILISLFLFLTYNHLGAQCEWGSDIYDGIIFSKMQKKELRLVERLKGDTIYTIWFNATVHESSKVSPHILWYHKGDSIIAYKIMPYYKKRYIIIDTSSIMCINNLQHFECFDKDGWDLLILYSNGKRIKSTILNQECILNNHAEDELEKNLQHDIAILRDYIPGWITHIPTTQSRKSITSETIMQ